MTIPTVIVVLGSPNSPEGNLYSVGLERCELAIRLYEQYLPCKLLLTGGFGAHFNTSARPHASYLRDRLVSLGASHNDFMPFAESLNTLEDASKSKVILKTLGRFSAIIVTSDYHLDRARFIFEREFADLPCELSFEASITNHQHCEFDLEPIISHEKSALAKLKSAA
ncbi:MAG: YdcF family protein [Bdellovibrionales bacterium]|nr:YdcF family protein [Bdellovibrionales bacterium]